MRSRVRRNHLTSLVLIHTLGMWPPSRSLRMCVQRHCLQRHPYLDLPRGYNPVNP